jgi:hypothetical protein
VQKGVSEFAEFDVPLGRLVGWDLVNRCELRRTIHMFDGYTYSMDRDPLCSTALDHSIRF